MVNTVMGLPKPEAIRILLDQSDRSVGLVTGECQLLHEDFTSRMRNYYATGPAVREVPGAAAAFAALRRAGIQVALNTGFSAPRRRLLARLGWSVPAVIDAAVTSDEVQRGRPHPDMIRHLMTRLGVLDPCRVAKVGDTKADLEEGANAGCGLVIGVTTGSYPRANSRRSPYAYPEFGGGSTRAAHS